jgi:hypothetical protein
MWTDRRAGASVLVVDDMIAIKDNNVGKISLNRTNKGDVE